MLRAMWTIAVLACVACQTREAVNPPAAPVDPGTAEICTIALPSIATVFVDGGRTLGSAFSLANGLLITAAHVIEDAKRVQVHFTDEDRLVAASIVSVNTSDDLALLQIAAADAPPPGLELADATLGPGESILMIGAPAGLEGTVTEGLVSAVRDGNNGSIYQLSIPVASGSSGSPILNNKGQVIGVLTAKHAEAEGVAFATGIDALHRLLATRDVEQQVHPRPTEARHGDSHALPTELGDLVDLPGFGVRMRVPRGWDLRGDVVNGPGLEFLSEPGLSSEGSIELSVIAEELVDPWSISKQDLKAEFGEDMAQFAPRIVELEHLVIDGERAMIYLGNFEVPGERISFLGMFVRVGNRVLCGLATAGGSPGEQEALINVMKSSLLSMRVIAQKAGASSAGATESLIHPGPERELAEARDAAKILSEHMMAGRYRQAAEMLPPILLLAMGGIVNATKELSEALSPMLELEIEVHAPSSYRLVTDSRGTSNMLVVIPTITRYKHGANGPSARMEGWLLASKEVGETDWLLMEGSTATLKLISKALGEDVNGLKIPVCHMTIGDPSEGTYLEMVMRGDRFVPTQETREHLRELLEKAPQYDSKQERPSIDDGLNVTPHHVTNTNLSIRFPKGWTIKTGAADRTVVKAVNPDKSKRIELVAVATYDLGQSKDLWELTPGSVVRAMAAKESGLQVAVLESGKASLGGHHALWSTTETKGPAGTLRSLNYLFMRGDTLYWIYGSTDGNTAAFAGVRNLFKGSIESCKFR